MPNSGTVITIFESDDSKRDLWVELHICVGNGAWSNFVKSWSNWWDMFVEIYFQNAQCCHLARMADFLEQFSQICGTLAWQTRAPHRHGVAESSFREDSKGKPLASTARSWSLHAKTTEQKLSCLLRVAYDVSTLQLLDRAFSDLRNQTSRGTLLLCILCGAQKLQDPSATW